METTAREVAMRASTVKALEERVAAMRVGTHRSQVARTLHDLAASVTPGVRFQALEVQAPESGRENFAVSGEVVTHARLAPCTLPRSIRQGSVAVCNSSSLEERRGHGPKRNRQERVP